MLLTRSYTTPKYSCTGEHYATGKVLVAPLSPSNTYWRDLYATRTVAHQSLIRVYQRFSGLSSPYFSSNSYTAFAQYADCGSYSKYCFPSNTPHKRPTAPGTLRYITCIQVSVGWFCMSCTVLYLVPIGNCPYGMSGLVHCLLGVGVCCTIGVGMGLGCGAGGCTKNANAKTRAIANNQTARANTGRRWRLLFFMLPL